MIYTLRIYLWTGNTSDNEFTEDTIWTVGFELNFVTKIIDTTFKRMVHTFKRMVHTFKRMVYTFKRMVYELIWTSSRKSLAMLRSADGFAALHDQLPPVRVAGRRTSDTRLEPRQGSPWSVGLEHHQATCEFPGGGRAWLGWKRFTEQTRERLKSRKVSLSKLTRNQTNTTPFEKSISRRVKYELVGIFVGKRVRPQPLAPCYPETGGAREVIRGGDWAGVDWIFGRVQGLLAPLESKLCCAVRCFTV